MYPHWDKQALKMYIMKCPAIKIAAKTYLGDPIFVWTKMCDSPLRSQLTDWEPLNLDIGRNKKERKPPLIEKQNFWWQEYCRSYFSRPEPRLTRNTIRVASLMSQAGKVMTWTQTSDNPLVCPSVMRIPVQSWVIRLSFSRAISSTAPGYSIILRLFYANLPRKKD